MFINVWYYWKWDFLRSKSIQPFMFDEQPTLKLMTYNKSAPLRVIQTRVKEKQNSMQFCLEGNVVKSQDYYFPKHH